MEITFDVLPTFTRSGCETRGRPHRCASCSTPHRKSMADAGEVSPPRGVVKTGMYMVAKEADVRLREYATEQCHDCGATPTVGFYWGNRECQDCMDSCMDDADPAMKRCDDDGTCFDIEGEEQALVDEPEKWQGTQIFKQWQPHFDKGVCINNANCECSTCLVVSEEEEDFFNTCQMEDCKCHMDDGDSNTFIGTGDEEHPQYTHICINCHAIHCDLAEEPYTPEHVAAAEPDFQHTVEHATEGMVVKCTHRSPHKGKAGVFQASHDTATVFKILKEDGTPESEGTFRISHSSAKTLFPEMQDKYDTYKATLPPPKTKVAKVPKGAATCSQLLKDLATG